MSLSEMVADLERRYGELKKVAPVERPICDIDKLYVLWHANQAYVVQDRAVEVERYLKQEIESRDTEIARLRAEVERKDEALRAAQSAIKAFNGPVHPFTGAAVRTAWDKITAALADTADKQGEQT